MSLTSEQSWNGKTWQDMPGADTDNKKMNFALFRRGLLEVEENEDGKPEIKGQRQAWTQGNAARRSLAARHAAAELRKDQQWSLAPTQEVQEPNHQTESTMRTKKAISERQLALKQRYLKMERPYGFARRVTKLAGCSNATFHALVHDTNSMGDELLDRLERAIEQAQQGTGEAGPVEVAKVRHTAAPATPAAQPMRLVVHPPGGEVTVDMIVEASLRLDAAKREIEDLTLRFAAQKGGHA